MIQRRRLFFVSGGVLATGLLALTAIAAAANTSAPAPPGVFIAKYHLSGYGVYHRTNYFDYTAAPCQSGGKGGGDDGIIRNDTTIRWETAAPATVLVQKIGGGEPFMAYQPVPGYHEIGIVANVTVTSKVTNTHENIQCNLDGSEDHVAVPHPNTCGTRTYTRGYSAGVQWPRVFAAAGERITVKVIPLAATQQRAADNWNKCWGAHHQFDENSAFVSVPLPFRSLPRRLRGKLTVIPHGHETVIDVTDKQNGQGGTVHQYDEYHETNYVTFIRIG